jgi:UDP-N-acetyl-D-mannosaminuronate dehydrogenase
MRESPAFEILKYLKEYEADIEIYEPYNLEKSTCKSLDDVLDKCEAIVIAANHTEFVNNLKIEKLNNSNIKVIVD